MCVNAWRVGAVWLHDRTGNRPPHTHISTLSVRPSLPGSFCDAIRSIVAIVARWPADVPTLGWRNFPSWYDCVGGCPFPIDPDLRADQAPVVWLPQLDPGAALLAGAAFSESIDTITPCFQRSTRDLTYWIIEDSHGRLPVVRLGGLGAATPPAAIVPIDADFATRLDALLRLRNRLTGRLHVRPPQRLTKQRRQRLALSLRALDGRLAHASYRVIAQRLFGDGLLPAGAAWKTHGLRNRTIRLARSGQKLMHGGYLELLRSPPRRRCDRPGSAAGVGLAARAGGRAHEARPAAWAGPHGLRRDGTDAHFVPAH